MFIVFIHCVRSNVHGKGCVFRVLGAPTLDQTCRAHQTWDSNVLG